MPLREGAKKNMSFVDKNKDPIGGKDASRELWATPTPLSKSIVSCLLSSLSFCLDGLMKLAIYMSGLGNSTLPENFKSLVWQT